MRVRCEAEGVKRGGVPRAEGVRKDAAAHRRGLAAAGVGVHAAAAELLLRVCSPLALGPRLRRVGHRIAAGEALAVPQEAAHLKARLVLGRRVQEGLDPLEDAAAAPLIELAAVGLEDARELEQLRRGRRRADAGGGDAGGASATRNEESIIGRCRRRRVGRKSHGVARSVFVRACCGCEFRKRARHARALLGAWVGARRRRMMMMMRMRKGRSDMNIHPKLKVSALKTFLSWAWRL